MPGLLPFRTLHFPFAFFSRPVPFREEGPHSPFHHRGPPGPFFPFSTRSRLLLLPAFLKRQSRPFVPLLFQQKSPSPLIGPTPVGPLSRVSPYFKPRASTPGQSTGSVFLFTKDDLPFPYTRPWSLDFFFFSLHVPGAIRRLHLFLGRWTAFPFRCRNSPLATDAPPLLLSSRQKDLSPLVLRFRCGSPRPPSIMGGILPFPPFPPPSTVGVSSQFIRATPPG